jgi:glycosyltransferase involved in cell wall biosynthesis
MPKLLYLVTEDWWFCQHFLPMARAARAVGYEIVVAARLREHAAPIAREGYRTVSLENERRSLGAGEILRSTFRMMQIVRAERPDLVHCIGLRMVVLGGLAARLAGARAIVLAPTGLGHLWIENGPIERLARVVTRFLVGRWLRRPGTRYLFENADDPREFGLDSTGFDVTLVGGAGVAAADFAPAPEPPLPVKIAVVARMILPKGIAESAAAVLRARARGTAVELHLFGSPDRSNRRSITESNLQAWSQQPGIVWHGATSDPAAVWREHHIAMLLSYREGLPRALVEAAATGRPIIATDVVGCREVVRDGCEGLLVALGDIEAAAAAVGRLAADPVLRARLGATARERFLERFSEAAVTSTMKHLYKSLAVSGAPAGVAPVGKHR